MTGKIFRVRLGTLDDKAAMAAVEAASFTVGAIGPLDAQNIFDRMTAHKRHLILVAELDSSVIGHALAYPEKGKLYLWSAAVQPDHRRQGVMAAILKMLFQIAHEQGFQHVFFRTSSRNVQMLRLALSMGFEIVDYIVAPKIISAKFSDIRKGTTFGMKFRLFIGASLGLFLSRRMQFGIARMMPDLFGGFYHVRARKVS